MSSDRSILNDSSPRDVDNIELQPVAPLTDISAPDTSLELNIPDDTYPSKRYQALLLLSGFLMIFHTIGINWTFGIFQEFYTSPQSNIPSAIGQDALVSLAGTIGAGLTWAGSIFVNPWMDKVHNVRVITVSGVVIMSLGIFLASFNTKLYQLYLTQSLLYGLGSSMYYFPILSLSPLYFTTHRGFAMGLILSGSGIGGLVLAPTITALIGKFGIGWTLRILGIWNLVVGVPVACVVRKREIGTGGTQGGRINMGVVRRGSFLLQSLGAFLQAAGNVVPTYYMTTYSTSVLSYSSTTASNLLALNNAVNSVSRLLMGILADRVGRQNTMITSVILSAITVFSLWYDAPSARFLAFIIFYGIYAGGYNALLPTTLTELYGAQNYSSVNSLIYFLRGLGVFVGAPVAGVILGSHSRSAVVGGAVEALRKRYNEVVVYDGVLLGVASVCVAYVRWLDARDKGVWRWKA